MSAPGETPSEQVFVGRVLEAAVRLALVAILVIYSYRVVAPFLHIILWSGIVAVGAHPTFRRLVSALGGRRRLAGVLFTLLMLVVFVAPVTLLVRTVVSGGSQLADSLAAGEVAIPPPPESVAHWPLVGAAVRDGWLAAQGNLGAALEPLRPQLRTLGTRILGAGASAGLAALGFAASLVIAGVLLVHAEGAGRTMYAVLGRLAGPRGTELAALMEATVRSVARGVLGVAFIQAMLVGVGFFVVDLPGAGLWTGLALLLATVQVGVFPVTLPAVVYVFFTLSTPTALLFLLWNVVVGALDNVLKPLLLGRGVSAPMPIIFLGAVGGLLAGGILGLFVGAVILVLAHALFLAWLGDGRPAPDEAPAPEAPGLPPDPAS